MNKVWKMVIVAISVSLFAFAGMGHGKKMPRDFRMVPMGRAELLQSGNAKMFCPKCGMTLPMFYRPNHAATVDGKVEQFCSMHCLVEEMNSGKKVSDIKVVDNSTLKFIPVQKAWYVVGSSKPATMSKVSKYAFGSKEAAEKFASENGGKVMNFADTLALAKKAYEKEAAMIAKKQTMMAQKGKAIYEKRCQKIDGKFGSAAEAKAYIAAHNSCPGVRGKMLQAVALYLEKR